VTVTESEVDAVIVSLVVVDSVGHDFVFEYGLALALDPVLRQRVIVTKGIC